MTHFPSITLSNLSSLNLVSITLGKREVPSSNLGDLNNEQQLDLYLQVFQSHTCIRGV